jgi:hypothetical protein
MEPHKIYFTMRQFAQSYPWPTFHGLRRIYKMRKDKGFEKAFLKSGRRIIIDVNVFWDCLHSIQNKEKS